MGGMEQLFLVPSSWSEWKEWFRDGAPQLAGIVIGIALLVIILRTVISRVLYGALARAAGLRKDNADSVERRVDTLLATLNWFVTIVVVFIGAALALDNLGLNVSALVASVGIAGVALGLGAQTLIKDVINGTFILIEDQYRVGDIVTLANVTGTVEEINPRRTVLRDANGAVHVIPNSAIFVATNLTQGFSRVNVDLPVPYETDIEKAIAIIDEACAEVAAERSGDILAQPRVLRVDGFRDNDVTVKVTGDVRAGTQWAIAGEIRRRALGRFGEREMRLGKAWVAPSTEVPPPDPVTTGGATHQETEPADRSS